MRFIKKEEQGTRYAGFYDLNGMYQSPAYHNGLMLTYLAAKRLARILDSKQAVGLRDSEMNMWSYSKEEFFKEFQNVGAFNYEFGSKNIVSTAVGINMTDVKTHKRFPLFIAGTKDGTDLIVYHPVKFEVSVETALNKIEAETFEYCGFPKDLISRAMKVFQMDERVAIMSLTKLAKYDDIFAEFTSGLKETGYFYPDYDPVVVRGHTAGELKSNYRVSVLGSYDLLIFLREHPDEVPPALERLKIVRR